jgi:transcriptional regulator with XRE-family HTH domain
MPASVSLDYTLQLRQLMQLQGISTFKALSQQAGVSEQQVLNLRRGLVLEMRVEPLLRISRVLHVSIADLLILFAPNESDGTAERQPERAVVPVTHPPIDPSTHPPTHSLDQEYQRLQLQLGEQRQQLWQEFQQTSLQMLETWLLQWSAAAYAAQQNPQLAAVKLLPLVRPIEQLLQSWEVSAFVAVGTEVPYDPQWHQLMSGTAVPGDLVWVRYAGYRQGEKLLHRAKVSLVA